MRVFDFQSSTQIEGSPFDQGFFSDPTDEFGADDEISALDELDAELDEELFGASYYDAGYGADDVWTYRAYQAGVNAPQLEALIKDVVGNYRWVIAFLQGFVGGAKEDQQIAEEMRLWMQTPENGGLGYGLPIKLKDREELVERILLSVAFFPTMQVDDAIYQAWKQYKPNLASGASRWDRFKATIESAMDVGSESVDELGKDIGAVLRSVAPVPTTDQAFNGLAVSLLAAKKIGEIDPSFTAGNVIDDIATKMVDPRYVQYDPNDRFDVEAGSTMVRDSTPIPEPVAPPPIHTIPVAPRSEPFFNPSTILTIGVGLMLFSK